MFEEEKFNAQDSLSDFGSPDFEGLWTTHCADTGFDSLNSSDWFKAEDCAIEETMSSTIPLCHIPIVAAENAPDQQITLSSVPDDVFSCPGPSHSVGITPHASLVATNNWPGDYGFNIHFDELKDQPSSKRANWIYSAKQDKLYVKNNVPCPVKFKTDQHLTCEATIRAFAVFDDARYANDVVQRCYNHYKQDNDKGIPFAKHLIRCECDQACYEQDPTSSRLSVSVQYENPQRGEKYSTYIFKFTCLGSCSGGLNRRPIKVIFNLERGGQIIGRRSIDVRICACPRRDIHNDEMRLYGIKGEKPKGEKNLKRKHTKSDDDDHSDVSFLNAVGGQHSKKAKSSATPPNGPYVITTNDRKQYHFLKQVQKLYLMHQAAPNYLKQCFLTSMGGSSESSTEDAQETDESDC